MQHLSRKSHFRKPHQRALGAATASLAALGLLGACGIFDGGGGGGGGGAGGVLASFEDYQALEARRGTLFAAERRTPREDLPTTGTADYTGAAVFVVDETRAAADNRLSSVIFDAQNAQASDVDAIGSVRVTADFSGAGSIGGSIDNLRTPDNQPIDGSLTLADAPINAGAATGAAVFQSSVSGTLGRDGETAQVSGQQLGQFVGADGAMIESFLEGTLSGPETAAWGGRFVAERD